MKRTKRFISLFLAIIMLLGAVVFSPTPVQAQGQGTEPPQWVKDQITQDLDTDLKDPGSVKLYTPIIEEDETYANRWHVKALIAARDTARTTDIVLVMDTSGSMKGNRMTSAIAAAHSFVNTVLQDGSQNMRVAIVPFAGEVGTETDFTDNITTLHAAINNMNAKGGTFTQGGIYKARQMLEASKANNKYMLVMSDGVPTYSYEIQDPDTYATDYVNDVAYDRGFLGNELRASGYATNANVAESDFTYNDYNKTGNGSYMYYLYQQGSLWSYNLFYNHGNSAVAEAGFAKNAGIHVYSIGLQTDADGSDVLRRAASKDSFIEVTNVADLEPEFKKIANNILKTVNDAKVHTEFNKGFEIPSDVPDNELKHSPGAKIITDTDGKKKWYMHSVSTVYDTDDSTLKYEYIEYVIDLNNDILDANGNAPGTVDLLKSISVEYIDVNGKIQTLLPASLPNPVTPTIITVKKVIKNNEGGAAVDNAQREFEFIVKSSDKSENYPSIKLRPGQTRLLERIKKASTYTIYESKIGKAYELKNDGGETKNFKEFDVADYYSKFKATKNNVESTTAVTATDGVGKEVSTGKISDLTEKQIIVFENAEQSGAKAKVTLEKLIENKTGQTVTPSGDKEFKITFAKQGDENSTKEGEVVVFNLNAGKDKSQTKDKMRFTTYVVKEDTESANPYTPKDKEQGKEVNVTLYDVLAGGDKGQEVSFTNVFDPDKKIDFTAEKKWEVPTGLTLKDADYPTMNFTLYRKVKGGTEAEVKDNGVKPAEITKEKRTAGWKNLDAFDASGNEYTYSVEETFKDTTDAKNANWITGKMVTEEGKNTITNKLKEVAKPGENPDPEKNPVGKLTIKKVLKNEAEATQMKALRAASEPIKFSFEVTGPYNYKETFKLAAGEEKELKNLYYGEYTVKETETETHGFEPSYNPKNGKATLKAGEAEKTIIVTNTNKGGTTTDPTNVTITVNKVWDGGTKPATEIELWRKGKDTKGTAIDEKVNKFATTAGQNSSQEFKTKEDGSPLAKFDPSGREFEYYAKELNVPANYKATYSQDKLTVTNTYNAPKDGEFTATKVWDMTGAGKDYPSPEKTDVWFKLYRNIAGQDPVAVEGADLKKIAKDATDLTAKWEGLDKTDKDGKTYIYRVKEVDADGKDFTPENFKKTEETNKVTNTILSENERTGKLTIKKNFVNTRPAAASLSSMPKAAPKALTFKATVTGPYGYSKEVELSTTEPVVLGNLYFGEYTVKEADATEYEATYKPDGGKVTLTAKDKEATVTVTNTVKADYEKRDITLTKTWENGPARTDEDITITLKRNNEDQTATATVTKTNDHKFVYTFKGQAVYDGNGKPYAYTVEEKVKDELKNLYTAGTIAGNAEEGFTVTNTYNIPKDGEFTATKVWAGDEKVTRPTMNFELWRKVGETDEKVPETAVKIVDGTNMTATWEKLEKTNQAGQEYTFYIKETFKEDSVENQNWKLGEFDDKSKSITNTVKTPNDGLGKLTIKKELLKTGEGVMVLRSAAEPVKFSFKVTGPYGYEKTFDLAPGATEELTDLYFGKYKVEETDSKGYTPTYNPEQEVTLTTTDNDITVTVTNTSKTDTNSVTEVTATKEWVNGPEEDHIAVDLTLKRISAKEGSEEETVNATATITGTAPTFTYKWSNLAKHDANGYEYTYFVEEPNVPENYEATYSQDKLTVTNTYNAPQTEEYLAIFNGNGGEPVTQKKTAKDGEVIADVVIPTKEGYKFVKWVKLGTNVEFDPTKPFSKDILDPGDNSVMFTAVWEKGETSEPNPEPQPEPQPTPDYNPWWPIWFGSSETKKEEPKPLERHDAYISGYPDGTVRPDGKITRAEVSAIFARLTESSAPANYSPKFSDVLAYDWFCDSVMKLSKKDIIKGYPDGTFKPNKSITRAEFAVIASKYIKNPKAADETFSDVPMNHWAKDAIAKVKAEGLISGYPDGTFKPDAPITRAEAVSIVNRMFDRVADGEFVRNHKFEIKSFKDLVENHWAYYKIYEATNGHDFVRDSNKIDEEWKYVTNKSFVYDK